MSRLNTMARFAEPDHPKKVNCDRCGEKHLPEQMVYIGRDLTCEYCVEALTYLYKHKRF